MSYHKNNRKLPPRILVVNASPTEMRKLVKYFGKNVVFADSQQHISRLLTKYYGRKYHPWFLSGCWSVCLVLGWNGVIPFDQFASELLRYCPTCMMAIDAKAWFQIKREPYEMASGGIRIRALRHLIELSRYCRDALVVTHEQFRSGTPIGQVFEYLDTNLGGLSTHKPDNCQAIRFNAALYILRLALKGHFAKRLDEVGIWLSGEKGLLSKSRIKLMIEQAGHEMSQPLEHLLTEPREMHHAVIHSP